MNKSNQDVSGILCAVETCRASRRTHPKRKFFKFPPNQILFDVWLEKCGLKRPNLPKRLCVCERHFNTECVGKRKLLKNSIPEYYLSNPDIKKEIQPEISLLSNSDSLHDLNDSLSVFSEYREIAQDNSMNYNKPRKNSMLDLKNKLNRFAKMIKYYRGQIKFLKYEIKKYQINNSINMNIDSMPNLSSVAKEFGKMIFKDETKEWPCIKCMTDIKVAIKLMEDYNSDNMNNFEVNNINDELTINCGSSDATNSIVNVELAGLEKKSGNSSSDFNSVVIKTEIYEEDETSFERSEPTVTLAKYKDLISVAKKTEVVNKSQELIQLTILPATTKNYECDKCGAKTDTYKKLIYHLKSHPDINLYECERCGKEFRLGSRYRMHSLVHIDSKPFKCKLCTKRFKCRRLLSQHKLTHKTEKIIPCSYCNKWFCHKKALTQHLSNCHKEKYIRCTKCSKKFHYNSQLKMHMELVHGLEQLGSNRIGQTVQKVNNLRLPKQFTCEICGKVLASAMYVERHIKFIHKKEMPFSCSYCSKKFPTTTALNIHIQHHINSKNCLIDMKTMDSYLKFKCDECDKAFTTALLLKNHKIIHSGLKEHKCIQCGKGFAFKWYLERHIRLIHDPLHPRNFICSKCGKVSGNVWAFNSHMLSHSGETPYHCKFCDSKFKYTKSLRLHVNNKHKSETENSN